MHCYLIPYQNKYIVYRPLRRLAFAANSALINLIAREESNPGQALDGEAAGFLERIDFFAPDPPGPDSASANSDFRPVMAVLFLTNACNFKCIYCYASAGEPGGAILDPELGRLAIDRVCNHALEAGQDHFSLSFHGGGEPTRAWSNLKNLVGYARSKALDCRVQLTSNGYWTRKQLDWILENIDEVSLSFDGAADTQNRQRPLAGGGETFETVMAAVRLMDKADLPYGIRLTVTDESIDDLPGNIAFLCRETGCPTFQVEPAFRQGRAESDGTALEQIRRFADAFMEAWGLADAADRHQYYSGARPWVITDRFCLAPDRALIVGPGGFLTGCYEICGPAHSLADYFIYGRLSAEGMLVRQTDRARLKSMIAARRSRCRDCFCYWHCAGDCPSKTFTGNGSGHLQFGERCELNRTITRELILRYMERGGGLWQGDIEGE